MQTQKYLSTPQMNWTSVLLRLQVDTNCFTANTSVRKRTNTRWKNVEKRLHLWHPRCWQSSQSHPKIPKFLRMASIISAWVCGGLVGYGPFGSWKKHIQNGQINIPLWPRKKISQTESLCTSTFANISWPESWKETISVEITDKWTYAASEDRIIIYTVTTHAYGAQTNHRYGSIECW